jgi:hypothetical protein
MNNKDELFLSLSVAGEHLPILGNREVQLSLVDKIQWSKK